ncbi:MAG: transposase [Nitrososphaerota archaeon]|nr:transposase [Nitrososphaerota archaeon]
MLLDSLSIHKVEGVWDPVFECCVFVWFLSVYSPDLNPVELLWEYLVMLEFRAVSKMRQTDVGKAEVL